jgi:hypothetical protein
LNSAQRTGCSRMPLQMRATHATQTHTDCCGHAPTLTQSCTPCVNVHAPWSNAPWCLTLLNLASCIVPTGFVTRCSISISPWYRSFERCEQRSSCGAAPAVRFIPEETQHGRQPHVANNNKAIFALLDYESTTISFLSHTIRQFSNCSTTIQQPG